MQKSLVLVIALFALGVRPAVAQTATPAPAAARPEAKRAAAAVAATPAVRTRTVRVPMSTPLPVKPEATAGEPKMTFWQKIFGRRKKATPAPVATASTPVATPASGSTPRGRRPRPLPPVDDTSAVAKKADSPKPPKTKPADVKPADAKPEAEGSAPVVAAKTPDVSPKVEPESPATPPVPAATPSPVRKTGKTRGTAETKNIPPPKGADEEVQEKYKYDMAKAKALTDPAVLKLKEKAESAVDEDEGRKAQRAYTKALFNKMRSIDGSIKERADRIEAGIMRRLESSE
jgi:hypothetical protein